MLSLDEAAGPLDPLADLTGDQQMLRIVGQREVEVAGGPATTYRLAWAGAAEGTVQAVELLWRAGPATLRLLVVRDALDQGATNAIFIFAPAGSPPAADNLDFVKADLRLRRTNAPPSWRRCCCRWPLARRRSATAQKPLDVDRLLRRGRRSC